MLDIDEILKTHRSIGPGFEPELRQGWYFTDAILKLHQTLKDQFEELIQRSGPSFEALAAGQLTARAVGLIPGMSALDRAQEFSTALSLIRVAEENASNLFYILYAGPTNEQRKASDLAEQFLVYREIDHARFIRKSRAELVERFKKGWKPGSNWIGPRTLSAFEQHCDSVIAKADATRLRFQKMGKGSWHNLDKETRTQRVLEHLPAFAEPIRELWASEAGITSLHNTLLHSGPMLFHSEPHRLERGHILNVKSTSSDMGNQSIVAAHFAEQCWFALGDVLGELALVQSVSQKIQGENILAIAKKHHVPAMWRID